MRQADWRVPHIILRCGFGAGRYAAADFLRGLLFARPVGGFIIAVGRVDFDCFCELTMGPIPETS